MAERCEAKGGERSFASKNFYFSFLTRSFASRFLLRFAQPFLAKFKWTINWSLSPQGLNFYLVIFEKKIELFKNLIIKLVKKRSSRKTVENFAKNRCCFSFSPRQAAHAQGKLLKKRDCN